MRMAFGLVGVLVALGVLVLLMNMQLDSVQTSVKARDSAKEQINAISGKDAEGVPFSETLKLQPDPEIGKLLGLRVTKVDPANPMAVHYGLIDDDLIVEIGPQRVKDIGDSELAIPLVMESKARNWDLVVVRGGQEIKLPQAKAGGAPPAPAASPTPSANPMGIKIPGQPEQ
jgi:hypothetical protein